MNICRGAFVWIIWACLSAAPGPSPCRAADRADEWRLAWSDSFDRPTLGDGWLLRSGDARIADGRLVLTGAGALLLINRPFASDVRLEFTAQAHPDAPPCDLSAGLACNPLTGYQYLLAFGGNNNRWNQILGARLARDERPRLLIEPGRRYHLRAEKAGSRLMLCADGQKLVETTDDDPVGGPGFDRVGLITWNGMIVDEVRVFERTTPAPGGPEILTVLPRAGLHWERRRLKLDSPAGNPARRCVECYNEGRLDDAWRIINAQQPAELPASAAVQHLLLAGYVLGDPACQERPGDLAAFRALAEALAADHPADRTVQNVARAARWFSRLTVQSRDVRAALRLLAIGQEGNPFYYKARLFLARYHYASALEGADRRRIEEARGIFSELKETWPEQAFLRELTGERVPWGPELTRPESDGPAWARHLQEAFARQQAIMGWWFSRRQSPDGQLGGGWGDDVEILRTWVPAACISTACEPAINGIERLADGVWTHALRDGFSPDIGDVEHSAEPSADALPTLLLLRYGDPLYVERNLRSAKTIREQFMATNHRGRLQFISSEFGADGVATHPAAGGDTGYHARAMKHFVWLGWYGIPQARETFLQWADTWCEATLAQAGTKPPGFAPASIFYPAGGIEPPTGRPWHDSRSHYYGFSGLPGMVHESLLTAHYLTGDRRYLDPVEAMLRLATTGPLRQLDPTLPRDHIDNLLADAAHHPSARILSVYRWLTGDRTYDEYLLKLAGSAAQRYQVNGRLDEYLLSFRPLAERLRDNWAARTSEVLQTDRAGLEGAWDVCSAYTGAIRDFVDAATPTMAVTWQTPDLDFAAVVTEARPDRLRVLLYSFHAAPVTIGLRPWQLVSGTYEMCAGEPVAGEVLGLQRYRWGRPQEVAHVHRGEAIPLELPGRTEWVVDLRLRERARRPALLPDLAVSNRDLRREANTLSIVIHNIGGADSAGFDLVVEGVSADESTVAPLARRTLDGLAGIHGFEPSTRIVHAELPAGGADRLRVRIDPNAAVDELCKANNQAECAGR